MSTRLDALDVDALFTAHMVADLDQIEADEAALLARRTVRAPARASDGALGRARAALAAIASLAAAVVMTSACASTGATFRSGVGDAYLEHPPYYAGARAGAEGAARVGHLPVAFQRGASQPAVFDPRAGDGSATAQFAEELTAYLDSLGASARLVEGRKVSAVSHRATQVPPDVHFGCAPPGLVPGEECAERGDSALGRGRQTMRLAVGRPSAEWTAWMRDVMRDVGVERALVVTLEVGQYLPRQKGWRGDKIVELGTGRVEELPWLTSLETPVMVLQLTGVLADQDGRAVRIGAEGVLAKRTRLTISGIGGQELLTDEDVERARTLRRDDLPGRPLAWKVAMRELVTRLTGRAAAGDR